MRVLVTVGGDLLQELLGLVAAAAKHQVHRLHAGRVSGTGSHRGGGESIGQLEIQQRHRESRAASTNSSGSGARSDSSVSSALRTVDCMSASGLSPSPSASLPRIRGQVHLACAGPPEFTEQRVRQPGHPLVAGALDGDQVHLLGDLQVGALGHFAQHVDGQRLALRQRVDHQGDALGELTQLTTRPCP